MEENAKETFLVPYRQMLPRLIVLVVLMIFLQIGNAWYRTILPGLLFAALLGTFPRICVSRDLLKWRLYVMFYPVHVRQWPMKPFVLIRTGLEGRFSMQEGCLAGLTLGLHNIVMAKAFDYLIPWVGGDYKLWLETGSGKRVLVWQGNGGGYFRTNLDLLEEVSGLPIECG